MTLLSFRRVQPQSSLLLRPFPPSCCPPSICGRGKGSEDLRLVQTLPIQVLQEDTQVLLRNSHRYSKKGDKMKPRWLGPYTIHKHLEKGVYQLINQKGDLLKSAVNQSRLKVYHTADESHESPVCSSDINNIMLLYRGVVSMQLSVGN